jgi:hypothetical protein
MLKRMIPLLLFSSIALPAGHSLAAEYKITVTRVADDLYESVGEGIFIKTRYCYHYVYGGEAVVSVKASAGYTLGTIIFLGMGAQTCDIEMFLQKITLNP